MKFEFGGDEETAQQARHKLDVWKQAFRLDKKLQYKLDRGEEAEGESVAEDSAQHEKAAASEAKAKAEGKAEDESHAKSKPKGKGKHKAAKGEKHEDDAAAPGSGGNVTLLVRLYFSSHEKLSEQRWFDRLPAEEPFKSASPKVIREGDPEFEESARHFSDLG